MTSFQRHPKSHILTQRAVGVKALQLALSKGASIHACQSKTHPISCINEDTQHLLCQTSGSSGAAKTIRRTADSWIKNFAVSQHLFSVDDRDCYAVLGGLSHSLSLYASLEALHVGADLCLLSQFRPNQQWQALCQYEVSVCYATPSQLRLLAASNDVRQLASMRLVFSGGGKLNANTRRLVQRLFPEAAIYEFYGAGETSFISLSDHQTPIHSVGKAYPDVNIMIKPMHSQPNNDNGNGNGNGNCNDNPAIGEIWVNSPYLYEGYVEEGIKFTRNHDEYISIGELGYLDDDGYLYLKGRKNRMFTVADHNVFPEEIEEVILAADSVIHCAVVPKPDILRGSIAVCFVAISDNTDHSLSEKALRTLCAKVLPPHAIPKKFHILEDFPMLASGKPDLVTLTELANSDE